MATLHPWHLGCSEGDGIELLGSLCGCGQNKFRPQAAVCRIILLCASHCGRSGHLPIAYPILGVRGDAGLAMRSRVYVRGRRSCFRTYSRSSAVPHLFCIVQGVMSEYVSCRLNTSAVITACRACVLILCLRGFYPLTHVGYVGG